MYNDVQEPWYLILTRQIILTSVTFLSYAYLKYGNDLQIVGDNEKYKVFFDKKNFQIKIFCFHLKNFSYWYCIWLV